MPKGYCIVSGQFFKGFGKPMGHTQKTLIPLGKYSYWLGVKKILGNEAISQIRDKAEFPSNYQRNVAISIPCF
jgi:hypothetical protein